MARGPRLVCPRGPVVPAWLGLGVPGSRIGGPVASFGVPAWSCGPVGPVVPSGFSLSSSLFAVWGPRSGIIQPLLSSINFIEVHETYLFMS